MEYQRITAYLMANLDKIDFPFIVFHSEKDTMVDIDGSKALFAEASVRLKVWVGVVTTKIFLRPSEQSQLSLTNISLVYYLRAVRGQDLPICEPDVARVSQGAWQRSHPDRDSAVV